MKKYLKDEEAGTTRNEMEPPGTSRHYLELAGISNKLTQKTRNSQGDTVDAILLPNRRQHKQQVLSQRVPSQIFEILRCSWYEMVAVKKWHKTHSTCNVCTISLEYIKQLYEPIITKSSILEVSKVSQIWLYFIYTLNKKNITTFSENKACASLLR